MTRLSFEGIVLAEMETVKGEFHANLFLKPFPHLPVSVDFVFHEADLSVGTY